MNNRYYCLVLSILGSCCWTLVYNARCDGNGHCEGVLNSSGLVLSAFPTTNSSICPGNRTACANRLECCWGGSDFYKNCCSSYETCCNGLNFALCCPPGKDCDSVKGACVSPAPLQPAHDFSNICPDRSACQYGMTCCYGSPSSYKTCCQPGHTCCSGPSFAKCCEPGKTCDHFNRECSWSATNRSICPNNFVCPNRMSCCYSSPLQNTCCKEASRCCAGPNSAFCCKLGQNCDFKKHKCSSAVVQSQPDFLETLFVFVFAMILQAKNL